MFLCRINLIAGEFMRKLENNKAFDCKTWNRKCFTALLSVYGRGGGKYLGSRAMMSFNAVQWTDQYQMNRVFV